MPNGLGGIIESLAVVMFAFGGIEIIGITSSEAKNPAKVIPQAINSIPFRILLFYVLTIFVLMAIYPWNSIGQEGSPFVAIFQGLGIGSAANILNIIVITAAISAINSDIFGAGRMMYGMAEKGLAHKKFMHLSRNGVPWVTIMVMTLALLCAVVLNYLLPKQVFVIVASIATFATVWVWLMILLSQFAMRRKMSPGEAQKLQFPVPMWPVAPILTIVFMIFIIAVLSYFPATRIAFYVGGVWIALLISAYYLWIRKNVIIVSAQSAKETRC